MPGGDRTGPAGAGPMTGRSAGYCAGYPVPGYMNPVGGRGFFGRGMGRGGGRGFRRWYYATGLPGWARTGFGYPAGGRVAQPYAGYPLPVAGPIAPEQEINVLKGQAESLQSALEEIRSRIEQLQSEKDK
jgi:hypothetical protein